MWAVALSTLQAVLFSVDSHPQKLSGFLGDCGEVDEGKRLWGKGCGEVDEGTATRRSVDFHTGGSDFGR